MANIEDIRFREHFENFLDQTAQERERSQARRDYRDLKQWTDEEARIIKGRGQAPIVFDQFSKKIDGLVGVEIDMRTDPKAYPRTSKHDKAAHVITDALRYVEDNNDFDDMASEVFEEKIVEGYGGAIVEYNQELDQIEINQVHWDRYYYDPHSRKKDFSDAQYQGMSLWLDRDAAKTRFPDSEDAIDLVAKNNSEDDSLSHDDRPDNWIDRKRDRIRVNQEYFIFDGVWHEVFYSGDTIISEAVESPYLDDNGKPMCPIEMECDFVDRDNNRWGWSQRLIDPQDEINHRRSKALHMLSNFTVIADEGAFGDLDRSEVLDELVTGKGFLEKTPNTKVEIDRQQELGQSQFSFYQDATEAIDRIGVNPELSGRTESAISGRAFMARQQGGMTEINRIYTRHSKWKRSIYRQVWARIKQFWTDEKWVRVTDDENAARFAGINVPVTRAEIFIEQQTGQSIEDIRDAHGEKLDQELAKIYQQDPSMQEPAETRNNVADLDMDIIVEESPDTINIQQEQFDTIARLLGSGIQGKQFEALLKLSSMSRKDEVIEMMKPTEEEIAAQGQQAQIAQQLQAAQVKATIDKMNSETAKNMADIPLKEAQTKDEMASAIERVGKTSMMGV